MAVDIQIGTIETVIRTDDPGQGDRAALIAEILRILRAELARDALDAERRARPAPGTEAVMASSSGKMELHILDKTGQSTGHPFEVDYAPNELTFSKAAQYADVAIPGLNQPVTQFIRGDAETLTLNLFLDSTHTGMGPNAESVTAKAETLAKLVAVQGDLHRPPLVQLVWGEDFPSPNWNATSGQSLPEFTAIVTSVNRSFTLFAPNGKPLRATVTLTLKRYATVSQQLDAINFQSADHTRLHIVTEGETLPLIAQDAYDDAAQWRLIADHNRLTDVRSLMPGQVLELPPLPTSATGSA